MTIDTPYKICVKDPKNPTNIVATFQITESSNINRHIDGSILNAGFKISYKLIESLYFKDNRNFSFAPSIDWIGTKYLFRFNSRSGNTIFLNLPKDLHGHRIGSFLFCRIIEWVKSFNEYEINVAPLELTAAQATEDNLIRRNKFYENIGVKIVFTDPEHKEGKSLKSLLTRDLITNYNWKKNIEIILD